MPILALSIVLTACTPEPVIIEKEVPLIIEVEKIVEVEVIREVIVEVMADDMEYYDDVWYYMYEDHAYAMASELIEGYAELIELYESILVNNGVDRLLTTNLTYDDWGDAILEICDAQNPTDCYTLDNFEIVNDYACWENHKVGDYWK